MCACVQLHAHAAVPTSPGEAEDKAPVEPPRIVLGGAWRRSACWVGDKVRRRHSAVLSGPPEHQFRIRTFGDREALGGQKLRTRAGSASRLHAGSQDATLAHGDRSRHRFIVIDARCHRSNPWKHTSGSNIAKILCMLLDISTIRVVARSSWSS